MTEPNTTNHIDEIIRNTSEMSIEDAADWAIENIPKFRSAIDADIFIDGESAIEFIRLMTAE